jgi:hypothetical protein
VIDPCTAESAVEVAQRQWQIRVIGNQGAPVEDSLFIFWGDSQRVICPCGSFSPEISPGSVRVTSLPFGRRNVQWVWSGAEPSASP